MLEKDRCPRCGRPYRDIDIAFVGCDGPREGEDLEPVEVILESMGESIKHAIIMWDRDLILNGNGKHPEIEAPKH